MAKGSPIQALYELCRKTFTSSSAPAVSAQAIRKLCALLDTIVSEDVGLKADNPDDDRGYGFFGTTLFKDQIGTRVVRWSQPITYLHIYECDSFTVQMTTQWKGRVNVLTKHYNPLQLEKQPFKELKSINILKIGIFCLPTSSVIPLHDHPGMTVLSKILYGSMHVKAYDWIEHACIQQSGEENPVRMAKLHTDTVLAAPCPTTVLYPKSGGNLHCFTAVASCAVLDVLAPPYSESAGRPCTYYLDYPYSVFSKENGSEIHEREEDYAWLEKIEAPDDLHIRSGRYTGPVVKV